MGDSPLDETTKRYILTQLEKAAEYTRNDCPTSAMDAIQRILPDMQAEATAWLNSWTVQEILEREG
jgi:hypothetical protein